jgi:hypothetical protein
MAVGGGGGENVADISAVVIDVGFVAVLIVISATTVGVVVVDDMPR